MALKDWKKITDSKIRVAFLKGRNAVFVDKTLSSNWRVIIGIINNPNQPFMSFMGTKVLGEWRFRTTALNKAKAYMRKN